MAEGDTILRTARRLEPLVGEEVAVRAPKPRGRAAGVERLDGTTVERIESHGKNLLIVFGELALHSHMGMNGSWHLYRRGARWSKPARSAWAVLEASEVEAVQFGGPTLRLLPAASLRRDATLARLGPDVLAPEFDPDDAVGRLRTAPEREIGDALLDQGRVAGIGNIFKSEALFAARVDPWARIDDLADEDLRRVLLAAREAMLAAVEEGRHRHAVYKLAGRPCPRCGAPLRSRGQGDANRTTYWCGICQGG